MSTLLPYSEVLDILVSRVPVSFSSLIVGESFCLRTYANSSPITDENQRRRFYELELMFKIDDVYGRHTDASVTNVKTANPLYDDTCYRVLVQYRPQPNPRDVVLGGQSHQAGPKPTDAVFSKWE